MSAPSSWWQLYLGIVMSFIVWVFTNNVCLAYGFNNVWSAIVAWSVSIVDVCGFYFLLEVAMMENEGMSIQSIYKEFFGERK